MAARGAGQHRISSRCKFDGNLIPWQSGLLTSVLHYSLWAPRSNSQNAEKPQSSNASSCNQQGALRLIKIFTGGKQFEFTHRKLAKKRAWRFFSPLSHTLVSSSRGWHLITIIVRCHLRCWACISNVGDKTNEPLKRCPSSSYFSCMRFCSSAVIMWPITLETDVF